MFSLRLPGDGQMCALVFFALLVLRHELVVIVGCPQRLFASCGARNQVVNESVTFADPKSDHWTATCSGGCSHGVYSAVLVGGIRHPNTRDIVSLACVSLSCYVDSSPQPWKLTLNLLHVLQLTFVNNRRGQRISTSCIAKLQQASTFLRFPHNASYLKLTHSVTLS